MYLGKTLRVNIFGQSHGEAIGVLIEGLPAGFFVDMQALNAFLQRRAPGRNAYSTARKEGDAPIFLSGLVDGRTCGSPLCAMIKNGDAKSLEYERFKDTPRPSHADYPARAKYGESVDLRGGGHFSGRLTAPLCIAGGIAKQMLEARGATVGAHVFSIGTQKDLPYDPVRTDAAALLAAGQREFPVNDEKAGNGMRQQIKAAKEQGDSIGGIVEVMAVGLPAGIGDTLFDSLESRLSAAFFAIPAVRGVEFGAGFAAAKMMGSEHNDPYVLGDGARVQTATNKHGGILGGITSGMPVLARVAFKPTPSIERAQKTLNLKSGRMEELTIGGRHDPCIVPRAVPVVEAAMAMVLLDACL